MLYEYEKPQHDNHHLYDLNYDIDKKYCMSVLQNQLKNEEIYQDPKHGVADNWKVVRLEQFNYADKIIEDETRFRFLIDLSLKQAPPT